MSIKLPLLGRMKLPLVGGDKGRPSCGETSEVPLVRRQGRCLLWGDQGGDSRGDTTTFPQFCFKFIEHTIIFS